MRITRTALVLLMTLAVVSCSTSVEQQLLSQFFEASRLRDLTALRTIATVVFEPKEQGIVTGFDVTRVVSEAASGGDRESKVISIAATVKLPDGRLQQKNFIVIIGRARSGGEANHRGGWMITGISGESGSLSTRPS